MPATTAALSWDVRMLLLTYPYAVQSVTCPACNAHPGEDCKSTGGGNYQAVPPHQKRRARLADWTAEQLAAAQTLVEEQGLTWWPHLPDGYYADTEQAAAPIVVADRKAVTPRGVRLSEVQAERIEQAAEHREGHDYAPTAHFHGDHQDRQTMNALETKGIFRQTGPGTGYERPMELTAFGWQVYRQHSRIIRRMPDADAAAFEAKARTAETSQAAAQQ